MIIVPFKAEHLEQLAAQPQQFGDLSRMQIEQMKSLEYVPSFTGLIDGKPVGCAGIMEMHPERALCWTFLGAGIGKHFVQVHRAVKSFIDATTYKRLEMEVAVDFTEGHRWAKMLGFEVETPLKRAAAIDGRDVTEYVRIR